MEYLERLKQLRKYENITQNDLAKELGISQNSYSQYETGVRELPIDILIKLADFYFTSTDYILGLTDYKNSYPKKK